ncbi:MAG: alpha/beta hydrolase [Proteobacteria bacterium]|nr:alpha/beta hydrolase [Pseudomonadota bacterium]
MPGGPGCDSSYLQSLLDILVLPGNVWLVDFPGNGSHKVEKDDCDNWLDIFIPMIKQFKNPILVGHSFGAQLPLLYPECEDILKGFVIMNSSPKIWHEEALNFAKEHNLPSFQKELDEFNANPSDETFKHALNACMPYYFPEKTLEKGIKYLMEIPFALAPANWWQNYVFKTSFNAKWIPQKVPTLIIGSELDAMCPFVLYQNDSRFDHIVKKYIEEAGHLPWFEKPEEVKSAFDDFLSRIKDDPKGPLR